MNKICICSANFLKLLSGPSSGHRGPEQVKQKSNIRNQIFPSLSDYVANVWEYFNTLTSRTHWQGRETVFTGNWPLTESHVGHIKQEVLVVFTSLFYLRWSETGTRDFVLHVTCSTDNEPETRVSSSRIKATERLQLWRHSAENRHEDSGVSASRGCGQRSSLRTLWMGPSAEEPRDGRLPWLQPG